MNETRVSILMPVYEPDPMHLRTAIDSVLAQTETDWTLAIRDDASDANVEAMVLPYLADPRIRFARNTSRLGIGGNWNATLRDADAPFVQYLFQDDTWNPSYLARALAFLDAHPSAGFVSTDHAYAFEGDLPERPLYESLAATRRTVRAGVHPGRAFLLDWMDRGLHPNVIGEPSFVLLRRTLTEKAGAFLEDMPQFLDVEYWTRCLRLADWGFAVEQGGTFRVHPGGASARNQRDGNGMFDRFRTMRAVYESLRGGERRRAGRGVERALAGMIRKFRARKKAGGATGAAGGGSMRAFAMHHPLMTLRALMQAIGSETRRGT